MKRISLAWVILALAAGPALRAQDAATEERLNKLSGRIDDLQASHDALRRQLEAIEKAIEGLREQINKPTGDYASQQDLKRLADAVREVDQKRLEDYEKIRTTLTELGKTIATSAPARRSSPPPVEPQAPEKPSRPDKGYEYVIKKGDTLSSIIQAYRENDIKVKLEDILKANPGLKPERMPAGKKIFIPAPQP